MHTDTRFARALGSVIFANYTSWPKAAIIMPVKRKILENLSLPGGLFFHRVVTPRTLGQRWISSRLNRVIRRKVVVVVVVVIVVVVVVVVVVVMTPTYATASNSGALEGARASAKLIRDNSSVAALIFYVTEQPVIPPCHSYRPINRSMTTLVYQCLPMFRRETRDFCGRASRRATIISRRIVTRAALAMHDDYERIRGTVLNDYVVKYRLALGLISALMERTKLGHVPIKAQSSNRNFPLAAPFRVAFKSFQISSPFLRMSPKFLLLLRIYSDWSFDWRNYRFGLFALFATRRDRSRRN